MRGGLLVSMIVVFSGLLSASGQLDAQTAGGSALEQGNALLSEIRAIVADASSRADLAESAQPPQVKVASCLNQIGQTLSSFEASASVALSSLGSAVASGDAGTAQAQLSLLILANKNAKSAIAAAQACEAEGVVGGGGGADSNGDGVPDGESSTGGLTGLDGLQGDEEVVEGFSADDYIPAGDSVEDPATSDVVTSPVVTP